MDKIENALALLEGQDVYFDTSPLIYFLDRVEIFFRHQSSIFSSN